MPPVSLFVCVNINGAGCGGGGGTDPTHPKPTTFWPKIVQPFSQKMVLTW